MTHRKKKLIEVALPLAGISEASAAEKRNPFLKGHPRQVHVWWARRPLAACRAVAFASVVDDPSDPDASPDFVEACRGLPRGKNAASHDTPRQRLFDFIEALVQWESKHDEQVLEIADRLVKLSTDGNPPPLFDPFAGGGSIPVEGQRLGLEVHAGDINPVAVMINKALIEIPPRFADQPPINPHDRDGLGTAASWNAASALAADLRYYSEWMSEQAWTKIGSSYPEHNGESVIAWLWARTVTCPNPACGAEMPLVKSFWLSKKKDRKAWIEPNIDKSAKEVEFTVRHGEGEPPDSPKVGRGAKFRCLVCGETAPDRHLKDEGMAGRMGVQLMAIVTEGNGRRNYHAPTPKQRDIASQAHPAWEPPGELADDTRAIWCKLYGLTDFADLFTSRQLLALTTFSDLIMEVKKRVFTDALVAGMPDDCIPLREGGAGARAYSESIALYMTLALSNSTNYMSTLCSWNVYNRNIKNTFSRQALPMKWDFAENNPFGPKLPFERFVEWIAISLERALVPRRVGLSSQVDATSLKNDPRYVVLTDPPYYDNIGYADLSDLGSTQICGVRSDTVALHKDL